MKRLLLVLASILMLLVVGACAQNALAQEPTSNPTSGTPQIVPDDGRTYEWIGIVYEVTSDGRYLQLKRECGDAWVLMPASAEASKRLENNIGNKVVIWGKVYSAPNIRVRPTIYASSVFGPGDPMPMTLVAIPTYPCPKPPPPAPSDVIELQSSELAARGTLVWESGTPYLDTPSGKIFVTIPAPARGTGAASPDAAGAQAALSLDVVAAGAWSLPSRGLTLSSRTLQPWPVGVLVSTGCYGRAAERLQPGEAAARGTLVWDASRPYLKTQSGAIYLTFAADQAASVRSAISGDAVVVGTWAQASGNLHMTVRRVGYMSEPCPPPPPPPPGPYGIMPGEIAAVGTLVWDNSQPYLVTPSGKILLKIPQPIAAQPEIRGDAAPNAAPAQMKLQVVAIGTWSISNGNLAISVRVMRPWPGPMPVPIPYPNDLPAAQ